ncbi:hypothetical protein GUITHDRAFT_142059 [Guillardia theta CCMP2712]|uniref:PDZ domain-containing protein n=2 Tax=Guillardia theta TaxID=55529 RepID=L1IYL9_GUITC|nr:hypothetical protein GUITHDRAFT_142059 [Guillardia theta CCMP2712]EKX41363.1 hypothetical protein GUITHDRAFT_142059 [Guillardia theta CCMP2712]|eukprot:XP_005828343.1 hypothetical protein GUITHDRAFT_142059 [Guillardia theta CCMP2712]
MSEQRGLKEREEQQDGDSSTIMAAKEIAEGVLAIIKEAIPSACVSRGRAWTSLLPCSSKTKRDEWTLKKTFFVFLTLQTVTFSLFAVYACRAASKRNALLQQLRREMLNAELSHKKGELLASQASLLAAVSRTSTDKNSPPVAREDARPVKEDVEQVKDVVTFVKEVPTASVSVATEAVKAREHQDILMKRMEIQSQQLNFPPVAQDTIGSTAGSSGGSGQALVVLPEMKNTYADYRFRLIVLTCNRPQSLARLLQSLRSAYYDGIRADLHVHQDRLPGQPPDQQTAYVVESLDWPWGIKELHQWSTHVGIMGNWIESWQPSSHDSNKIPIFLEDDLEVSPFFARWFLAAHKRFAKDHSVAGFSGMRAQLRASDPREEGLMGNTIPNTFTVFKYKLMGTWSYSPKPRVWREFRIWYEKVRGVQGFLPVVEGIQPSVWYLSFLETGRAETIWEMWHIRFMHERGLYCVYPWLFNEKTLVANWREAGLHYEVAGGKDFQLLTSWDSRLTVWPDVIPALDWDGHEVKEEGAARASMVNFQYTKNLHAYEEKMEKQGGGLAGGANVRMPANRDYFQGGSAFYQPQVASLQPPVILSQASPFPPQQFAAPLASQMAGSPAFHAVPDPSASSSPQLVVPAYCSALQEDDEVKRRLASKVLFMPKDILILLVVPDSHVIFLLSWVCNTLEMVGVHERTLLVLSSHESATRVSAYGKRLNILVLSHPEFDGRGRSQEAAEQSHLVFRIKLLVAALSLHPKVLLTSPDMGWLSSPLRDHELVQSAATMVSLEDRRSRKGLDFVLVHSSDGSKCFWKRVLRGMNETIAGTVTDAASDVLLDLYQSMTQEMEKERLVVSQPLDPCRFRSGRWFLGLQWELGGTCKQVIPVVIDFLSSLSLEVRLAYAKQNGLWFLQDDTISCKPVEFSLMRARSAFVRTGLSLQVNNQPQAQAQQPVMPQQPSAQAQQPVMPQQPSAQAQQPVMPQQPSAQAQQPVMPQQPSAQAQQPVMPQQPSAQAQQPAMPQQPSAQAQQPVMLQQPSAQAQQLAMPQQPSAQAQQLAMPQQPSAQAQQLAMPQQPSAQAQQSITQEFLQLQAQAAGPASNWFCSGAFFKVKHNTDLKGRDIGSYTVAYSVRSCCHECSIDSACVGFTWVSSSFECWKKAQLIQFFFSLVNLTDVLMPQRRGEHVGMGLVVVEEMKRNRDEDEDEDEDKDEEHSSLTGSRRMFVVSSLLDGSPAQRSREIDVGDVLEGVFGRSIDVLSLEQLKMLFSDFAADEPIELQFSRDPQDFVFDVERMRMKVMHLREELRLKDEEQQLLVKKIQLLEGKLENVGSSRLDPSVLEKIQRKYDKLVRKRDQERAKFEEVVQERDRLKQENAELKGYNVANDRLQAQMQEDDRVLKSQFGTAFQTSRSPEDFYYQQ